MNESASYRFDDFCLFPARRELWRAGERLVVQPKVLDALVYLIQHRDRAVGSDELVSAVWGRVDLSDNGLGQLIARARRAVGDSGESQHTIRTMPRFGFRWVREVEVLSAEEDPASPTPHAKHQVDGGLDHPRHRWRVGTLAMALAGLLIVGIVAWGVTPHHGEAERAPAATTATAVGTSAVAPADLGDSLAALRTALDSDQLDAARAILRDLPEVDRLRPEVRYEAARLALEEGHADGALTAFTTLLRDLESEGNPLLAGKSAHGAAQAAFRLGDTSRAQRYYEQSADILGKSADTGPETPAALGRTWLGLGGLFVITRAFDDASRAFAKARIALDSVDDPTALARLENNVALMLTEQYRHAEALPRLEAAADLARKAGDAGGELFTRVNLVNTYLAMLQPAPALASEPRLRELRGQLGDPISTAHVDLTRARVLMANGQLRDAEVVLRALAGRPTPSDAGFSAVQNLVNAELAFERAAWRESSDHIRSALASDWYSPDSGMAAYARWRLLLALQAQGDRQGMAEVAVALDAQTRASPGDATISLFASLARGQVAATQGDMTQARTGFERALAHAETNRMPHDLLQVAAAYVPFLVRQGEEAKAAKLAHRVAIWADGDYGASLVQLGVYHATGNEAWRSALARTQRLAGERSIPAGLASPPRYLKGPGLASVSGQ